jgi:hypothetical protein
MAIEYSLDIEYSIPYSIGSYRTFRKGMNKFKGITYKITSPTDVHTQIAKDSQIKMSIPLQ